MAFFVRFCCLPLLIWLLYRLYLRWGQAHLMAVLVLFFLLAGVLFLI